MTRSIGDAFDQVDNKVVPFRRSDDHLVASPNDPLPNAQEFLDVAYDHPDRPLLVHQGGAFRAWSGTAWPEVEDAALRAALYQHFADAQYEKTTSKGSQLVAFEPNRYSVGNLLDALQAATHLPRSTAPPAWLDDRDSPAADHVACDNGIVHVPSRTIIPATPNLYVHHAVPYAFEVDAPPPARWLAFLDELWPDDPAAIECLQEIVGYLISGDTAQQKIFLIVGPKRGGKGTIGRVLRSLIGPHHVAGPTLAGIGTNFGLSPLIGKPLAIVSDARLSRSDAVVTERLLTISGEDTITIDRKYRDPWTGKLGARFLLLTNELPRLTDASGALASRFVMLTLQRSFYGHEDTSLTDSLLTELPGIFNWALDGLERLRSRGHFDQPASSAQAIRELEDLGSPISAFLRDRCIIGAEHTVACDQLYRAWRAWCEDQGRDHPGTAQTFGRDLRAAIPGIKITQPRGDDGRQHRHYDGIGVGTDNNGLTRVSPRVSVPNDPVTRADTRTNPLLSTDENTPTDCSSCGQPLLLREPGRTTCARCKPAHRDPL